MAQRYEFSKIHVIVQLSQRFIDGYREFLGGRHLVGHREQLTKLAEQLDARFQGSLGRFVLGNRRHETSWYRKLM
jgi:hypothetical protein